jgi:Amt family ammonium transporter
MSYMQLFFQPRTSKIFLGFATLFSLATWTTAVFAQSGDTPLDTGDTAWMLTSTALVLMMTVPGLILFYGGMVRKKNVLAAVMQSFATVCLVTILWTIVGYSIAFGEGNAFWGGFSRSFLTDLEVASMTGTIPESVFMTFQMTFAIITPVLITGAFVDRMKFSSLLVFNTVWVLLIYAPIAHWVWGGGFLGEANVLDFAGGTVVHINAGIAGLVAAIVIGKRLRYGTELFAPHSLVLSVVGASLLWVGWFGFNAGSAVAANGSAGMAMAVTQIAAAAGGLAWMFVEWILRGKPSALGLISGVIAGLVAITPAAGFVGPVGAIIIGFIAGIGCFFGATTLKRVAGYDDSLDAFGVHGIGGIIGAVLTGVFAVEAIGGTAGALEGNMAQIGLQLYGVGVTVVYCGVGTFIILKIIDKTMGLRVNEKDEAVGLDISLHGERGYEL